MTDIVLAAEELSAAAFAPFGDVIEWAGRESRSINDGTCRRFDDLAAVDVAAAGGRPLISVFEASPRAMPLEVRMLERHPLSSQAFMPLEARPFLIIVADDVAAVAAGRLHAFLSTGRQGVNYRRNTWHHPLLALDRTSRFLVVDRGGPLENCDEAPVDARVWVTQASLPPFFSQPGDLNS